MKKSKKFFSEFKTFIERGNVVDLAVGVIIGSAFGKIVTSLVDDILMPIIGVLIGGLNFSGLTINVGDAVIKYGIFLQNIINFLIIAFSIFSMIKVLNRISHKKEEEEKVEEIKKTEELIVLEEIRDLLKK